MTRAGLFAILVVAIAAAFAVGFVAGLAVSRALDPTTPVPVPSTTTGATV